MRGSSAPRWWAGVLPTGDEGGDAPAQKVVEPHGSVVDVSHFADHAVDVQPLQEEPGEGAEVEEVQQDGHHRAQELRRKRDGRQDGSPRSEVLIRNEEVTGLSAWLIPRMKMSSERKSAAPPLLMMLVLLLFMVLRQRRKSAVRRRKPRVTPTVLQVRTLRGRISPF